MSKTYLNIARFFLILLFLLPDFVKVIHSHKEHCICESRNCCSQEESFHNKIDIKEECKICNFEKFSFEEVPALNDYSYEKFVCEYLISFRSSTQKSYLLDQKLLRSPPII